MTSTSQHRELFADFLETLPAAVYACDAQGLITQYNEHAAQLWGRRPALKDPIDRFCGSFHLYHSDGNPMHPEDCWTALALRNQKVYRGHEIIIERPDGTRVMALAHASPIHDSHGKLTGAVNVLVDISKRKASEESLRLSQTRANEEARRASVAADVASRA